ASPFSCPGTREVQEQTLRAGSGRTRWGGAETGRFLTQGYPALRSAPRECARRPTRARAAAGPLAGRLTEVDPQKRSADLADRSLSCTVPDLGVTFVTKLGPDGAGPVTEAGPGDPPAQVRFSAPSAELLAISGDPKRFVRSWLTGKGKVEASLTAI